MKATSSELQNIVIEFSNKIIQLPDEELSVKRNENAWSKKEVIGHLIDSAQNNLRRFICGQYEIDPPKIVYDQVFWVATNNYDTMIKEDITSLWRLINERIVEVLQIYLLKIISNNVIPEKINLSFIRLNGLLKIITSI